MYCPSFYLVDRGEKLSCGGVLFDCLQTGLLFPSFSYTLVITRIGMIMIAIKKN